jgi:alpha-mannosidase
MKTETIRVVGVIRFGILVMCLCVSQIGAAESWKPVWTIGNFDGSSGEFRHASFPGTLPVYTVGSSTPSRDWYAFAPGSGNGQEGQRPHPEEIQFSLSTPPAGAYRLRVAILVENPRISSLQVEINGLSGRFYPHPKLDFRQGDLVGAFSPIFSSDTIDVVFPARYLQKGKNRVVLTAVDEPGPGDESVIGGAVTGNSGLVYDAIALENDPGGKNEVGIRAWAVPTIYYRTESGELKNEIDVFASLGERPRTAQVRLELNGRSFTDRLPSDREFGEFRTEFLVPEFDTGTAAVLMLTLNGHTRHFPIVLTPGKKWTIFVVPHEHLDVGYSDYQAKVSAVQARVIDEAMELVHQHPDFCFSLDGYWDLEQYLQTRTAEERNAVLGMIKDGKIYVPPQYANLLTGMSTAETLIRSLYAGASFSRMSGTPVDYANITDVPSYSWSYASVLAAAGLKYFVAASNNDRAPVLLYGHLNEQSPFWWEGPDGSKIWMWYSRHYHQVLTLFGLPPQIAAGHDSIPIFLQMFDRPSYRSDAVILYGTQVENTDLFPQQAALTQEWNRIYAYPKLVFSGFSQAMGYIAKQFGPDIPTVRGDGGPYWEDGAASDARNTALGRENEVRALSAEKFSTISTLVDRRMSPGKDALRQMWNDLIMMDEHTWGAYKSISAPHSFESVEQLEVKDAFASDGHRLVNRLIEQSLAAIANSIQDPHWTLLVFNSLNWKRTGWVETDLPDGFEIVERGTQQPIPYEVLFAGNGEQRVRFLASNVPSVGYKAFVIQRTNGQPPQVEAAANTVLEGPYYRVEVDIPSGAIRSVFDKQLNKELVDTSSLYHFGQYVYVTGADQLPNRLVEYSGAYPAPELRPHAATNGKLLWVRETPFGPEARVESSSVNTPRIETTILVRKDEKKIEFAYDVEKQEVFTREGVYIAFPFAMERPAFHYEIQNGVVDPAHDMIPGAGHEWFTVQHWVSAEQNGVAAIVLPLDAPLITLGDITRGTWPREFGERRGTIFSYLMNNYWHTNYRAGQGGHFTFRYIVASGPSLDEAALSRLGWEEITPLEVDQIVPQDQAVDIPRPLDPSQASFLQVSNPDVLVTAWKQAEDSKGLILRFLELGGHSGVVRLATPLIKIRSAWLCNAVEVNQQQLSLEDDSVTFEIKPHQILSLRVEAEP